MKKLMILLLLSMNIITINAGETVPTYKIIANSNSQEDIKIMYENKEQLLNDYRTWIKGVDDPNQVLADQAYLHNDTFYNGEYTIVLGKGEGKSITGKLQVSYCTSSKDIKKKSLMQEWFGN